MNQQHFLLGKAKKLSSTAVPLDIASWAQSEWVNVGFKESKI